MSDKEPSISDIIQSKQAREFRAFPKLKPGFSAMLPNINRAGLFPPVSNAKDSAHIDCVYPVACYDSEDETQGSIRYIGARMSQFHKRVLLGLLERVAGKEGDQWVSFHAVEFLESVGKEGDTRNVNRLFDALAELRAATFCIREHSKDRGQVFGWLNEAEFSSGSRQVRVLMSGRAAMRFGDLGRTYLPMSKRNRLDDGLQTWLFDFLFSSEQDRFSYEGLADLLERKADADFGKAVRSALVKLHEVDAIEAPEFSRGRFTARKKLMS